MNNFSIHFLNVGHGDCTIIEHASGRISMIDINNGDDISQNQKNDMFGNGYSILESYSSLMEKRAGYKLELTNPIAYLREHFPGKPIHRLIITHPDMDHMRGLRALIDDGVVINNLWHHAWDKEIEHFKAGDEDEWEAFNELVNDAKITKISTFQGNNGVYFNQGNNPADEGDGITILSPSQSIFQGSIDTDDWNNASYVLKVKGFGYSFLLPGDAESLAWVNMVAKYGSDLESTVLKASHHGRESGFHEEALKRIKPWCVVVSVGKKPETDAHNLYKKHTERVWSTRWHGNIVITIGKDASGKSTWTCTKEYER
jgi:competence protein ComEC